MQDAPGLRAFVEAHPEVDVFLHEEEDTLIIRFISTFIFGSGN
jgi:hypothetical protein